MPQREPVTPLNFLRYIFTPSKQAKPTGLRKKNVSGLKGGRKKARVNAFNKMPAEKQEVIRRAHLQEEFLRGEVTYTQAKAELRERAVANRIVKPKKILVRPGEDIYEKWYDAARHLNSINSSPRKKLSTIVAHVGHMTDRQRADAMKIRNEGQLILNSRKSPNNDQWMTEWEDGTMHNVLWYH